MIKLIYNLSTLSELHSHCQRSDGSQIYTCLRQAGGGRGERQQTVGPTLVPVFVWRVQCVTGDDETTPGSSYRRNRMAGYNERHFASHVWSEGFMKKERNSSGPAAAGFLKGKIHPEHSSVLINLMVTS